MLQMFHLCHTITIKIEHLKKKAETEISIQPFAAIWTTLMEGKLL